MASGLRLHLARFVVLLLLVGFVSEPAKGEEQVEAFLEQLMSRGYDDVTDRYFEQLQGSNRVSKSIRDGLRFQQAELLIARAQQLAATDDKRRTFEAAKVALEDFVEQHRSHPNAILARGRLASVEAEFARITLVETQQDRFSAEEQKAGRKAARKLFTTAGQGTRAYLKELQAELAKLPGPAAPGVDESTRARRKLLSNSEVEARVTLALVLFEQAETYETEKTRVSRLKQAEKEFGKLALNYRRRLAGLTAQLYQGRCRMRLGNLRGALACFDGLVSSTSEEEVLRSLKTRALAEAMDCWLDPELKELETARQRAEVWLSVQRPNEKSDRDWLRVKLALATVYKQLVDEGDQRKPARLLGQARRLAQEVAQYASEHQPAARALLADLGVELDGEAEIPNVATFEEAFIAARDALSRRQLALQALQGLGRNADANDAGTQEARSRAESQIKKEEDAATTLLRKALQFASDETPVEQLNQVRYYLCTLYYYQGDYAASAVMGEFLATRYPASDEGRRAASVVLAAFVQLYGDGTSEWATSIERRTIRTAELMIKNWEGDAAADEALSTLVNLAVRRNDAPLALKYLDRMQAGSAKKTNAAVMVGQSLWNLSLRQMNSGGATEATEATREQAVQLLMQAVSESDTSRPPTISDVNARLILAQHLSSAADDPLEALKVLDDKKHGPTTLLAANHPLVADASVAQRISMTALLTYVAALPQSDNADELVDKALASLDRLRQFQGGEANQLQTTYVTLAQNLERQVRDASGRRRDALVRAFGKFLARAADAAEGRETLIWVADAYSNLGQISAEQSTQSDESKSLFGKAVDAYRRLLATDGDEPLTAQQRLLIKSRLATCLASQGDFSEAIEEFVSLLKEQPNQVYVQLEAARTLLRWGDAGNSDAYLSAITGTERNSATRRNIVWGYGRLAKLVAGKPTLASVFFESRLKMAECRYKLALQQPKSQQASSLARAERDIKMTSKLYPDLGGEASRQEFDALIRQIQKALGKQPVGL